MTSFMVKQGH